MINFAIEDCDKEYYEKVITRALALNKNADRVNLEMDISATHSNGNPLDFEKLYGFDDFNFQHDMGGIAHHLNRKTGELEDFFSPRCSK